MYRCRDIEASPFCFALILCSVIQGVTCLLAFTDDRNVVVHDAQEINFMDVAENLMWPVGQ